MYRYVNSQLKVRPGIERFHHMRVPRTNNQGIALTGLPGFVGSGAGKDTEITGFTGDENNCIHLQT